MSFDIHKKVIDAEHDEEAIEEYTEELFALFVASPEAKAIDDDEDDFDGFYWAHAVIGFGIDYCDVTPAQMSCAEFQHVLFEIIPRKVSCNASQADEIVCELKAFWRFLQRAYGLENAAECLAVLDAGATNKLERKLADPSNFGMAKSFVAQGKEAGFDVETEEGLQAWVNASNSAQPGTYPLPNPIQSLRFSSQTGSVARSADSNQDALRKAKKKQRKLKAASRKRNR